MICLFKKESICRSVDSVAEVISDLLAREKETNPFLKNIEPNHLELCIKNTYLNHYAAYSKKEVLEVFAFAILHDLKKEVDYIDLTEKFRILFTRDWPGKSTKLLRFMNEHRKIAYTAFVVSHLSLIVHLLNR